jgi:hypothetical protein
VLRAARGFIGKCFRHLSAASRHCTRNHIIRAEG